jgi:hypothetical protein
VADSGRKVSVAARVPKYVVVHDKRCGPPLAEARRPQAAVCSRPVSPETVERQLGGGVVLQGHPELLSSAGGSPGWLFSGHALGQ